MNNYETIGNVIFLTMVIFISCIAIYLSPGKSKGGEENNAKKNGPFRDRQ